MKGLIGLLSGLFLFVAAPASAATLIVDSNGKLIGARGVDIAGRLYNVDFVRGSCAGVFSGCNDLSDFEQFRPQNVFFASQVLLDQVLIDGPAGLFDSVPSNTFGCPAVVPNQPCAIWVPVSGRDGMFSGALINNNAGLEPDRIGSAGTSASVTLGNSIFARFYLPATAVPEPSIWAMLLLGFGVVGGAMRSAKRRQRVAVSYA